jgi:hypothetical protein
MALLFISILLNLNLEVKHGFPLEYGQLTITIDLNIGETELECHLSTNSHWQGHIHW